MTRDQLNLYLAAILSTLAETGSGPESSLYLAIGVSLDEWETIKYLLVHAGFVTEAYNELTITEAGRAIAAKVDAARQAKG